MQLINQSLLGSSIFWEKSSSTFIEWYQDSSAAASQASKFNRDCDNICGVPVGDGVGQQQSCLVCNNPTGSTGFRVSEHL